VLLYSTGFQVNLGVISALVGRDEFILADKSNHASIVDGCCFPRANSSGSRTVTRRAREPVAEAAPGGEN
jgi:hypothetical protein